jgi:uncharacterized protein YutE (UPF0331/DUF86 family)
MNNKEAEWTDFFNKVFAEARRRIFERYPLEKDGSGSPQTLAIRDVAAKLPCPVRIAEIRVDTEKHKHIEDAVCQIIRYDFSKLGTQPQIVEYYGLVDARNTEELQKLLAARFDLKETWFDDFNKDFRTTGWFEGEVGTCTQFPLYDIKANSQRFVFDFLTYPFHILIEKACWKARKHIDWTSKFGLQPDPILSAEELTRIDKTVDAFKSYSGAEGIEKLQQEICGIQLIPSVPGSVKKVFQDAKDLHTYGFFRYSFFAVAQHYTYLALESAIKNRYYQSFGKENTLQNEKRETLKVGSIDHQSMIDLCQRMRWDIRKLRINGEKFARNTREVLDWLVRERIINEWERKQCSRGITLRNIMSHPTRALVFPPSYSMKALEFVADFINRLYSSSPHQADDSRPVFPADLTPSVL